jgi:hypothetical protein
MGAERGGHECAGRERSLLVEKPDRHSRSALGLGRVQRADHLGREFALQRGGYPEPERERRGHAEVPARRDDERGDGRSGEPYAQWRIPSAWCWHSGHRRPLLGKHDRASRGSHAANGPNRWTQHQWLDPVGQRLDWERWHSTELLRGRVDHANQVERGGGLGGGQYPGSSTGSAGGLNRRWAIRLWRRSLIDPTGGASRSPPSGAACHRLE